MSDKRRENDSGNKPLRNHKDTVFRMLFSEKERAIELYNALTGENLPPDADLVYTTLVNAIYADSKNDLGFVANHRHLVLSEQQSTINENIPLRSLGYVSRTEENLVRDKNLYGRKLVKIPAPEFYVFYTGEETWPNKVLRLSDSFMTKPKENSLELVVKVINLNYNESNEILERSPSLMGYSKLLHYIKEAKVESANLKEAIDDAVMRCIDEGLIEDFLRQHSKEVSGMLFKEITMEEFAEIRAREAYGDGVQKGLEEGKREGLEAGRKEGLEALRKGQYEIARKLKVRGTETSDIAEITGLEIEEIEKL